MDDVFQIAGRGCVVCPGIPRSSDLRLKIGDKLWIERPDGSELSTEIHGIELGGPVGFPGIPILVDPKISKEKIPIGSYLSVDVAPAGTLTVRAWSEVQPLDLRSIFPQDVNGHLSFGWSGRSRRPASVADFTTHSIEFSDYLLEGFVSYHLQADIDGNYLNLVLMLHGTNRDQYLKSHVAFHLNQAGLSVEV